MWGLNWFVTAEYMTLEFAEMLLTIGHDTPGSITKLDIFNANVELYGQVFCVAWHHQAYDQALSVLSDYEDFLYKIGAKKCSNFVKKTRCCIT